MSNLMKIAIPLINKNITLEDIQKDSGFVDAYFEDKNRPWLTNHIFLMYDLNSNGSNLSECWYKLQHLENRYGTRTVFIKEKPYIVFTFTIDKTIENLRTGNIVLNLQQKKTVLDFWGVKDSWILNNLLLGVTYDHPTESILPEEDYAPEPDFGVDEKGEVLE